MLVSVLIYNFMLLGVDLIASLALWKSRHWLTAVASTMSILAVSLLLAVLMQGVTFAAFHLLAYGWFLHVPLLLIVGALFQWERRRKFAGLGLVAAAGLIVVAVDCLVVEPYWLEVSRVELRSSKLDRPLRIALVADLQTDRIGIHERNALTSVMRARPDLILWAGDYLQSPESDYDRLLGEFKQLLAELNFGAPRGAFAVAGNTDVERWKELFQNSNVTVLPHTSECVLDDVKLTALSVNDTFDPELNIANDSRFHIVLGHAPDYALGQIDADLLLAGHTHGGQVQLPGIGPLLTLSRVPRKWASGVTQLPSSATLIVSRGVGMERRDAPRLRFLCRPEVVIIDVLPMNGGDRAGQAVREVARYDSSSPPANGSSSSEVGSTSSSTGSISSTTGSTSSS